jgi:DNA modification methylase
LHCFKGDPGIVKKNKPNVITIKPVGNTERDLLVERPIELYAEILDRLTLPGEAVLDLFVGSGSVLAAAAKMGRPFLGIEISSDRRAVAIKKVAAHMPKGGA